jgi:hypothetical protein
MKVGVLISLLAFAEAKKKCHKKHVLPESAYQGTTTGPNGEHLGGKGDAKPADMTYVPIPRTDYAPKNTIKCAFEHIVPQTNKIVTAHMKIDTKRPTLNLDNFLQIKKIDCVQDLVRLTFDTAANAKTAYDAWANTKDLAVMLGYQHKCKDVPETATLSVEKILSPDGATLVIDTVSLDAKDVITEYELDITQNAQSTVSKRNLFSFLDRKWSRTLNYPFSVNFDRQTQTVVRPEIKLLDTKLGVASCNNCFTHGDASIGLHIRATLIVVREYKVHLFGDFKANMDLALQVFESNGFVLPPVTLWSLPLTPIQVPGIFHFGPELLLQTGVSLEVPEPISVQYGWDLGFKFDYGIQSTRGLFAKPELIKQGIPTLREHQFKATKDIKVKVAGHLIPAISMNLSVLRIPAFDMRLQLDSSLGVSVTTGKFMRCPEDKLQIELFHEHDFTFDIRGPRINTRLDIYKSGQLPIKCFFCDKCFPKQSPVLSLPIATSTSVSSTTVATSVATTTSVAPAPISTTTVASSSVASSTVVSTSAASSSVASTTVVSTSAASTSAASTTVATTSVATTTPAATSVASTSVATSIIVTSSSSSAKPKPTCDPYDYACLYGVN